MGAEEPQRESVMIVRETQRSQWNDFVAGSQAGDFMQAWEWGELKARTGWRAWRLAVCDGETIVGAMQILQRGLPGGKSLFYAPRGPLCDLRDEETLGRLLAEARGLARQQKALALRVDPAVGAAESECAETLRKAGFKPSPGAESNFGGTQPRYVMKVDISMDEEALLASFHPKWRYNLRLAEKKGVRITSECTREDVPLFYEVLQETCKRDGFAVRAISYYYDIWDLLIEQGLGAMFLGRVEDQVVCGALTLALGRQAWYVYGASSNRFRNTMPNHLMQWEMMKWAKQRDCSVYDMRGVARETGSEGEDGGLHGLNRFKRGFGAVYSEYLGEFDLVYSPLWYGLFNFAETARRQWRHRQTSSTAE